MNLERALGEVLARLEAGEGVAVVDYDAVISWDVGVLDTLLASGLLKPAAAALSIECHGCEERCFTDVVVQPGNAGAARAFIVCDVHGKQEIMGRIPIKIERLRRWHITNKQLARFLCGMLGMHGEPEVQQDAKRIPLGMLQSANGRRWVSLLRTPLALEVNQQQMPLTELLFVESGVLALDMLRIQSALAAHADAVGKNYAPNTNRRETRKLATEAMYQDWQDAHAELQLEHPGKLKKWYSGKLAKLPVSQGRDSETIRRRLK